ncbi:hypothetical protein [Leucobacter chromiiresistens]|uniref:Uncharacterized protein n=1 Tax=Leucobacter chromiiresistens TaxID=1079994 RepID=A0A147ERI3_9MICO|nr:hypothetical protein [Leucobacter chromiiresistens]KTR87041.1 hypothetical protein NS354_01710 [Leucobacter chromiiresistens]
MSRYLGPAQQLATLPEIRRSNAAFHLSWSIGFVVLGAVFVAIVLGAASRAGATCSPGLDCSAAVGASRALTLMMIPFGLLLLLAISLGGAFMIRHRLWFNRSADGLRRRPTGTPVVRVFERTWHSDDAWNAWIYERLRVGDLAALHQLGMPQWHNLGDLYVHVYEARADRVAYVCIGSNAAMRRGVDTGWRPIVMTGAWYDYTLQFFRGGAGV